MEEIMFEYARETSMHFCLEAAGHIISYHIHIENVGFINALAKSGKLKKLS